MAFYTPTGAWGYNNDAEYDDNDAKYDDNDDEYDDNDDEYDDNDDEYDENDDEYDENDDEYDENDDEYDDNDDEFDDNDEEYHDNDEEYHDNTFHFHISASPIDPFPPIQKTSLRLVIGCHRIPSPDHLHSKTLIVLARSLRFTHPSYQVVCLPDPRHIKQPPASTTLPIGKYGTIKSHIHTRAESIYVGEPKPFIRQPSKIIHPSEAKIAGLSARSSCSSALATQYTCALPPIALALQLMASVPTADSDVAIVLDSLERGQHILVGTQVSNNNHNNDL